jgi:hypothetical protein
MSCRGRGQLGPGSRVCIPGATLVSSIPAASPLLHNHKAPLFSFWRQIPISHARSPLASPAKTPTFSRRPRAHTFRRAPRLHHHPSLSRRRSPPPMDGDDFLPEGGKLPELKLGACARARASCFVPYFLSALGFGFPFFLLVPWLGRCEASAGFHLLLQEVAQGASLPDPHLSYPFLDF